MQVELTIDGSTGISQAIRRAYGRNVRSRPTPAAVNGVAEKVVGYISQGSGA